MMRSSRVVRSGENGFSVPPDSSVSTGGVDESHVRLMASVK